MRALTKPQKILAVMFDLGRGKPKALPYEDIVVAAFERYPSDFQLRGYPEYPDSSDIHKPLYQMKKKGLVRAANKTFELTPRGLETASRLVHSESQQSDRLTKQEEQEIGRILASAAFRLFKGGQRDGILDTDFYEYLGVTVRTSKSDFQGRLTTVESVIAAAAEKGGGDAVQILQDLHTFLLERFAKEISARA
ncbi:MAG: hypothetical protein R6V05_01740 [Candidatus Brocadiia bacterium]